MRLVPIASIALACALGATAARADNVTFPGFAHGSETVAFSLTAPNAVASGTVSAGGFATILNGSPSFVSYCVDLYQHIAFGTLYSNYTAPGTTHAFANNRAYADLGRLYAAPESSTPASKRPPSRLLSGRSPTKRHPVRTRSAAVRRASAAAAPQAVHSASHRRGSPASATTPAAASA